MVDTAQQMAARLHDLDGKGYGAYRQLRDVSWQAGGGTATVERTQSDPYAPPSRVAVTVPADVAAFPESLWRDPARRRGLEDALLRALATALGADAGSPFSVDAGGQQVLDRSACIIADGGAVTVNLAVSLPAAGRRIRGLEAADLLAERLPNAVAQSLRWDRADRERWMAFCDTVEDAVALRAQLAERDLVAFVADDAVLPRHSGVDERPLPDAVPFASPPSLRVELDTPNAGTVTGMGVPAGVTLIVGGGYHGKSTLLRTLERGVYDHVPGDGRERCVTRADAMKVRAEDGRRVTRVDVSACVGELPTGDDTRDFSTDNASGSTSQAATTLEALEAGSRTLLIDEDTAATNLMIRDARMQQLIAAGEEPLVPFCDLVQPLFEKAQVSTVLVVGGSGDYFGVADTVVCLHRFEPDEITARAKEVAEAIPGRRPEAVELPSLRHRVIDPRSVPLRVKGKLKTKARGRRAVQLGGETVELDAVEQLVDGSQAAGIAQAIVQLVDGDLLDGKATLAEALDRFEDWLGRDGAARLRGSWPGDLAVPRRLEVAAALNRLRTLGVTELREG